MIHVHTGKPNNRIAGVVTIHRDGSLESSDSGYAFALFSITRNQLESVDQWDNRNGCY